jgi:HEAT repeat protein
MRISTWRPLPRVVIVRNAIDPTMDGIDPALLAASREPIVGLEAAHALPGKGEWVMPELIAALKDRDAETRHASGVAQQVIGPAARAAVPALLELLESEADRWWTGDALRAINPKAATAAGITGPN